MSDSLSSDQDRNPDQSVIASQQAQPLTPQNVQGSAMLDADIHAGGTQPEGTPISDPIATNFSNAAEVGDSKTAGVASEMGAFSQSNSSAEKGVVNLHNNPDVPRDRSESPQGKIPDTDPMTIPLNSDTNLPD